MTDCLSTRRFSPFSPAPSTRDAAQPFQQARTRGEGIRLALDQQVAGEEMAGDAQAVEDLLPRGFAALDKEGRQRKEAIAILPRCLFADGAPALRADEGEISPRAG